MQPSKINALTSNDSAVLQALFDPEASLSSGAKIDPSLSNPSYGAEKLIALQDEERLALQLVNQPNPSRPDIELAISKLDHIIDSNPHYASAWNNRAQATRILQDAQEDQRAGTDLARLGKLQSIFNDLGAAISHATPASPVDPVPPLDANVLASAYTHRGYLLWQASRSADAVMSLVASVDEPKGLGKEELEEAASRDFFMGDRYGNQIARELAVPLNPYAKLCGSIVEEAMRKEISDHYQLYPDQMHD